jgi:hypothetical protein
MERQHLPPEVFARLGGGEIAYVKPMTTEAFGAAFPNVNVSELSPGLSLWALLNADGTPIMIADSREAVIQNAWEHDLRTVSLH